MPHANFDKSVIEENKRPEYYLEKLWNDNTQCLAYVGKNGEFLKVNKNLCELLEYTESELEHRRFQDITHPDDLFDDEEMLRKLYNDEIDYYIMSKRYISKEGKILWIKLKVTRINKEDSGEVLHYLSQISPAQVIRDPIEQDKLDRIISEYNKNFDKSTWMRIWDKHWPSAAKLIGTLLLMLISFSFYFGQKEQKLDNALQKIDKLEQHLQEIKQNH